MSYEDGQYHVRNGGGSWDLPTGSQAWQGAVHTETQKAVARDQANWGAYWNSRSGGKTATDANTGRVGGSYSGGNAGGCLLVGVIAAGALGAVVMFGHDKKSQAHNNAQPTYFQSQAQDDLQTRPQWNQNSPSAQSTDAQSSQGTDTPAPQTRSGFAGWGGQIPYSPDSSQAAGSDAMPGKYLTLTEGPQNDNVEIATITADANFYMLRIPAQSLPSGSMEVNQDPATLPQGSSVERLACNAKFCVVGTKFSTAAFGVFGLVNAAKTEVTGNGRLGDITGIRLPDRPQPQAQASSTSQNMNGLY